MHNVNSQKCFLPMLNHPMLFDHKVSSHQIYKLFLRTWPETWRWKRPVERLTTSRLVMTPLEHTVPAARAWGMAQLSVLHSPNWALPMQMTEPGVGQETLPESQVPLPALALPVEAAVGYADAAYELTPEEGTDEEAVAVDMVVGAESVAVEAVPTPFCARLRVRLALAELEAAYELGLVGVEEEPAEAPEDPPEVPAGQAPLASGVIASP